MTETQIEDLTVNGESLSGQPLCVRLWGEEYAAILAYILEENDLPAGAEALETGALADIRVTAP